MHGAQHAGDELVNAITLMYERNQGRDSTFIVADVPEVGEDQLLELLNLVLEGHEVGDSLVALVGVVYGLQAHVFLVLEGAVEFGMLVVEGQLC